MAISSVSLVSLNTVDQTIHVKFTVSWDNAWKDEINNDAVWIFVKYAHDAGAAWSHATITSAAFTPTGASISVPADQKGVFIQPANYGTGTQTYTAVELVWAYGLDGVTDAEVVNATYSKVKVFGIEMVYIPASGFYAGDNATSTAAFKQGSSDTKPWFIPNENAIHVTNIASGGYYYTTNSYAGEDASGTDFWIPQDFPKGYKAFYMMKYEISEGQWVAFFNTLTDTQKGTRDITSASGKNTDSVYYRNTVYWVSGDATTTRSARSCAYISVMDVLAYAAWSGLRPMTELEFEKAARGPLAAVSGEYAWGTTSITACAAISAAETGAELCSTASANCTYSNQTFTGSGDGGQGPTRGGIYATTSTATARATAGAGFYGNLDLSGNTSEVCVTVGNATGRAFVGSHGDGTLSTNGNATNPDWPGYSAGEVTGATGSGGRGGHWCEVASYERLSERVWATATYTLRNYNNGGRCVRTAP